MFNTHRGYFYLMSVTHKSGDKLPFIGSCLMCVKLLLGVNRMYMLPNCGENDIILWERTAGPPKF